MSNSRKNVLVTGASRGIGFAISKYFAEKKYNVFITARNVSLLEKLSETENIKGFYACDLTKDGEIEKLYDCTVKTLGSVDILINNAGAYVCAEIEKTTDENISDLLKLNVEVPYKLSRICVPEMKKNQFGRIINIGSVSGIVGEGYATLYSMTKSSFVGFSKALALETAAFNITVNTIHPGWVDTELIDVENRTFDDEQLMYTIPQRRFIEPVEVAYLAEYLASEKAKGITGQSINLCAGITMG